MTFEELQAKISSISQSLQRKSGEIDAHLNRLRSEYGMGSIEEAEESLADEALEIKALEQELEQMETRFVNDFSALLDA